MHSCEVNYRLQTVAIIPFALTPAGKQALSPPRLKDTL